MEYKIAFVGESARVEPFRFLGMEVFSPEEASIKAELHRLIDNQYGVIFITEIAAQPVMEFIKQYDERFLPAFIIIPSDASSPSIGLERIEAGVKKAIGQQILQGGNK